MEINIKIDSKNKPHINVGNIDNQGLLRSDYDLIFQGVTHLTIEKVKNAKSIEDIEKVRELNKGFFNRFQKEVESKGIDYGDIVAQNL